MDGWAHETGVWVWPIGWKKLIFVLFLFLLLPTWHSVDALNTAGRGGSGLVWSGIGTGALVSVTRHVTAGTVSECRALTTTQRAGVASASSSSSPAVVVTIFVGLYLIHTDLSYFCITIDITCATVQTVLVSCCWYREGGRGIHSPATHDISPAASARFRLPNKKLSPGRIRFGGHLLASLFSRLPPHSF